METLAFYLYGLYIGNERKTSIHGTVKKFHHIIYGNDGIYFDKKWMYWKKLYHFLVSMPFQIDKPSQLF